MHAPQIITIVLLAVSFSVNAIKHGQTTTYNIWHAMISLGIWIALLCWGGFF